MDAIEEVVKSMRIDHDKFYNDGNDAAGTRYRKGCQQLKVLAQSEREKVTETRKS